MKNCNDCVYSSKAGASGNSINCQYPLPHALTLGSLFADPSSGADCPLLTTKSDLAESVKSKLEKK